MRIYWIKNPMILTFSSQDWRSDWATSEGKIARLKNREGWQDWRIAELENCRVNESSQGMHEPSYSTHDAVMWYLVMWCHIMWYCHVSGHHMWHDWNGTWVLNKVAGSMVIFTALREFPIDNVDIGPQAHESRILAGVLPPQAVRSWAAGVLSPLVVTEISFLSTFVHEA